MGAQNGIRALVRRVTREPAPAGGQKRPRELAARCWLSTCQQKRPRCKTCPAGTPLFLTASGTGRNEALAV